MNDYVLSNGVKIPAIGYGTWAMMPAECAAVTAEAIRAGYRHIDTAFYYGTEEAVGQAVTRSGIDRSELFLTTKAWQTDLGYDNILRAFDRSLENMNVDYIDLFLIHWPLPVSDYPDWEKLDRESWRAMERLYEQGGVKAVGVSNFLTHHMKNLLNVCNVPPMVDQIEFHPGYLQWETVQFCKEQNILVEAWSPLGRRRLAEHPLLLELANQYGVSLAQICLRFAQQCGVLPLPKSANPERMRQNLKLEFSLTPSDMDRILTMPQAGWSGLHPDRNVPKDARPLSFNS